jgi:uncharacterized membrane protein YqiK
MKPRHLISAPSSSSDDLIAIVRRLVAEELAPRDAEIAALKARQQRQGYVAFRIAERVARLEGADAETEITGQSVDAFARKVHRSPETIRKLIRQGRIRTLERLGVRVIIADDAVLPPRRRKSTIRPA